MAQAFRNGKKKLLHTKKKLNRCTGHLNGRTSNKSLRWSCTIICNESLLSYDQILIYFNLRLTNKKKTISEKHISSCWRQNCFLRNSRLLHSFSLNVALSSSESCISNEKLVTRSNISINYIDEFMECSMYAREKEN